MREWLDDKCDDLDAVFFSGDALYCKEDFALLSLYVKRWSAAIEARQAELDIEVK